MGQVVHEYTGDHLVRSMCEVVNAFVPIELYESTFGSMSDGNVTCYETIKSIATRDDDGCRQNWSVMQYIENYTGTGLKICATPLSIASKAPGLEICLYIRCKNQLSWRFGLRSV